MRHVLEADCQQDGSDTLVGFGFGFGVGDADVIASAGGANDLSGLSGANSLIGYGGADLLNGTAGDDRLEGASGADQFVLADAGVDTITDFAAGVDRILLGCEVFGALSAGALAKGAFVRGSVALVADDRILYSHDTGLLLYDADGSGAGAAVHIGVVSGLTGVLGAGDLHCGLSGYGASGEPSRALCYGRLVRLSRAVRCNIRT